MRLADFFPIIDICHVDTGPDHIVHGGSGTSQHSVDIVQALHGLGVWVADADQIAIAIGRRGAGDKNLCTDFHRS